MNLNKHSIYRSDFANQNNAKAYVNEQLRMKGFDFSKGAAEIHVSEDFLTDSVIYTQEKKVIEAKMDLNTYQKKARSTAIYPANAKIIYPALGLASEAGEVAGKVKKSIRDFKGLFSDYQKVKIADELGDVLWYVAVLAEDLGFTLDGIAKINLTKLESRQERNQLGGSGDER